MAAAAPEAGAGSAVAFTVPGEPVGKGRPRFDPRSGRTYTPAKTRSYERAVRQVAGMALGDPAAWPEGAVTVTVTAVKTRPKRLRRRRDPAGLLWAPVKPDPDNIAKAILDGLSPWFDDQRVVELVVRTYYAEKGGEPRVHVRVGMARRMGGE